MNARETLQALLDGKIIIDSSGYLWRLEEYDELVLRKPEGERWEHSHIIFNDDCKIYNEYPLTFEQALREMLDGKVVEVNVPEANIRFSYRFNRELSCFEFHPTSDDKWRMTKISECEQKSKWKVVE